MSIIGAVAIGAALGKGASSYIFNYTKGEYEAKISELDALIARLNQHLNTLTDLRARIPQFWDDDNAQATSKALELTMNRVQREMDTAESLARTFRTTVESMDQSKEAVKSMVDDALGILSGLF